MDYYNSALVKFTDTLGRKYFQVSSHPRYENLVDFDDDIYVMRRKSRNQRWPEYDEMVSTQIENFKVVGIRFNDNPDNSEAPHSIVCAIIELEKMD